MPFARFGLPGLPSSMAVAYCQHTIRQEAQDLSLIWVDRTKTLNCSRSAPYPFPIVARSCEYLRGWADGNIKSAALHWKFILEHRASTGLPKPNAMAHHSNHDFFIMIQRKWVSIPGHIP